MLASSRAAAGALRGVGALARRRLSAASAPASPLPPPPPRGGLLSPASLAWLAALGACSGCALLYQHLRSRSDRAAAEAVPLYEGNPVVYLDVCDGDEPVGRLVLQLRADAAPRTAENFRALCVGAMGWGYRSSPLHSVEKGRRVFGGDFFGGGSSGFSIYGDTFEDEAGGLALVHGGPGVVGMRNWGPDTNNSQFYITQGRLPELDGRCVVVGNVMEGWEVLAWLDKCAAVSGGRFGKGHNFRIKHSGELGKEYVLEGKPRVNAPLPQPPSAQPPTAQP
jgi:cyclophilin family peptidyl-prolyl cis-trans isomerase